MTTSTQEQNSADPQAHPPGFCIDRDGIWFEEKRSGKRSRRIRICGPLVLVKACRDASGDNWGWVATWKDPEGKLHKVSIPWEQLAGDGRDIRARLLSGGLYVNPERSAQNALARFLSSCPPREKARCVSRLGWHHTTEGRVYVMPDAVFGGGRGEEVIFQSPTCVEHPFNVSGEIADWKRDVAAPCVGNSRLMFSVSAALASILLEPLHVESGGFHWRGGSSIGKTTLLNVAGSVWGGGRVGGYVDTWRATDNGLEALASMHCDSTMCLDELSQVEPRAAGAAAYMLSNGRGKGRANRQGEGRVASSWRVLFLSTGELSLSDKLGEDGRGRVTAGQEVRVVDIPAEAGRGLGIFESLPQGTNAERFARTLKEASSRFYGTAARSFLAHLVVAEDQEGWELSAAARLEDFVECAVPRGADGQVRRVARRFGLVAAAGELGIRMDVLPWPAGSASEAALACFQAWLRERGGSGAAELAAALRQIGGFIASHGASRFEVWDDSERDDGSERIANRAGYKRLEENGWHFYVMPEVWKNEVCRGLDSKRTARDLVARGVLIPDQTGNKTAGKYRVPGLGQYRLYCLSWDALEEAVGGGIGVAGEAGNEHVPGGTVEHLTESPAD